MNSDGSDDDHSDIPWHATVLPMGGTASGVIGTTTDVDVFSASLTAGTLYQFVLTPLTGHPVFQAAATPAFEASGNGLVLSGTPWHPLAYTVAVAAPDGPASYRVSVQAVPDDYPATMASTGTLALGGAVNGRIEAPGDRDWIAVQLTAGQAYQFHGSGVDVAFLLAWQLPGGDPSFIAMYEDASFIPYQSGTYYLTVEGKTPGAYTATLTQPADDIGNDAAHARALAAGGTLAGSFDYAADKDAIHVHAAAGHTYRVTVALDAGRTGFPEPDFDFALRDLPAQIVDRGLGAGTSMLSFYASKDFDADFLLSATALHGPAGYTVTYQDMGADDFGDTAATAGRIAASGTTTGRMDSPLDVDAMRVTLAPGVTYQISVGGALAATGVGWTTGLGLSTVLSDSQFTAQALTVTPHAGEETVVYVRDASGRVGDYTVSVFPATDDLAANAATTGRLAAGGNAGATFENFGDRDWFALDLNAGVTYLFKGGAAVSRLAVVDANGKALSDEPLTSQDRSLTSLAFTPSASGRYYLEAGGQQGKYEITAGSTPHADDHPGPTVLAPGAAARGTIDFADDVDSFVMDLKAGHLYTFTGTTHGANYSHGQTRMTLVHLDGDKPVGAASIDAYSPALVPEADGRYRISFSADTYPTLLDYELALNDYGGGHPAVPGGLPNGQVTAGNDVFIAMGSGAYVDGGAGLDTVVYDGTAANRPIHALGQDGFRVGDDAGGQDLVRIERVVFTGQADAVALDVGAGAIGGEAYRLYQAAFDRTPDKAGVGYWMSVLERGASLRDVAAGFIASEEFRHLYGASPANADFVDRLYQNVLHRAPDQGGHDYWVGRLEHGAARADILASFSESPENVAAVAQIIGDGFQYTPSH